MDKTQQNTGAEGVSRRMLAQANQQVWKRIAWMKQTELVGYLLEGNCQPAEANKLAGSIRIIAFTVAYPKNNIKQ